MRTGEKHVWGLQRQGGEFQASMERPGWPWHRFFTLVDYRSRGRTAQPQGAEQRVSRPWVRQEKLKREGFQGPGENC